MRVKWLGQEYEAAGDVMRWLGPEADAVESKYGRGLDELSPRQMAYAIAFVTIKRHQPRFTWAALDALTLGEVLELIVEEPGDRGEDLPEEAAAAPADPTGAGSPA